MINTSEEMKVKPQKGYRYLVKEGARCLQCGDKMVGKPIDGDLYLHCFSCDMNLKIKELNDNAISVEVF